MGVFIPSHFFFISVNNVQLLTLRLKDIYPHLGSVLFFVPFFLFFSFFKKMSDNNIKKHVTDYMISENESSESATKSAESVMERMC